MSDTDEITFRPSSPSKTKTESSPVKARFVGDDLVEDFTAPVKPQRPVSVYPLDNRPIGDWGRRRHSRSHAVPPSVTSDLLMALLGLGAIIGWGILIVNLLTHQR